MAIRLGWQPSKLSRIGTGIQGVQAADVASLLVIYGITWDERKRLLGMAERSAESGWWEAIGGLSDESRTLIRLEAEATSVVNWQTGSDFDLAFMRECRWGSHQRPQVRETSRRRRRLGT
ncbi:hypothetical protein OOJ91_22965 [Micromonospora lupini]|uniref:hypothetical protein n=1 Tax=Micromonospora lupini TaxID=285679 RepID=UPI0022582813|nr:hypothetical protein [Micromonospora lupini]MCX5068706.1 hypothetical protein [Micromonospora lupini]